MFKRRGSYFATFELPDPSIRVVMHSFIYSRKRLIYALFLAVFHLDLSGRVGRPQSDCDNCGEPPFPIRIFFIYFLFFFVFFFLLLGLLWGNNIIGKMRKSQVSFFFFFSQATPILVVVKMKWKEKKSTEIWTARVGRSEEWWWE